MNGEWNRSLARVTVAQLANSARAHNTAPFKMDNTVFGKVMLVGNLAGEPTIQEDTGEMEFQLDDSTGRIFIKLVDPEVRFPMPAPYSQYTFSTVLRVIGTIFVPQHSKYRMIKAEHCSVVEDPHEPYYHLLQTVVDYMLNEKGPFPSDAPVIERPITSESREDEEGANFADIEQGHADFQELTSSLANTKLDASDLPAGLPIPGKPRDKELASGSGSSSGHLYPPQSPHRQSISPPRVAYYPKAGNGNLDFVFLDTEGTPEPPKVNGDSTQHVYPPHSRYPRDTDFNLETTTEDASEEVPPFVGTPNHQSDFAENGDLDESFVFLDSSQVQSRANGAAYLPSTRHRRVTEVAMSISPPRSFLRRHSPPQRDTPSPSKKARIDPYSELGPLERDIIITIHSVSSRPASLYYSNNKSNDGISRDYIIQTMTKKKPRLTTQEIGVALENLVNEAYLARPIDKDHFVIN